MPGDGDPLEDLYQLVLRLRGRIERHRDLLASSEAQTRISLIDPLLRALGWPTDDPEVVRVEVQMEDRRGEADYVLFSGEKPVILLEAKRLRSKLEIAQSAVVSYAFQLQERPPYIGMTDGQLWVLHEITDLKNPKFRFDLLASPLPELVVRIVQSLWRRHWERPQPAPSPVPEKPQPPPPPAPPGPPSSVGRVPLSALQVQRGDPEPKGLYFPGGKGEEVGSWAAVLAKIAAWLVGQGKLTREMCPLATPGARNRYLVHWEPKHPSGRKFFAGKEIAAGLWIETDMDSKRMVDTARWLLKRCGVSPEAVLVDFPPGHPALGRVSAGGKTV